MIRILMELPMKRVKSQNRDLSVGLPGNNKLVHGDRCILNG